LDKERNIIRIFMQSLGKDFPDPDFETDAITFRTEEGEMLFSTDEFSSEDNFRCHHPADLGWNLAAATISDIHAAGGVAKFYGHSVTVQSDWSDSYIRHFSESIAHCLAEAGATFIGGDLGMSGKWKYTGIVLGKKLRGLTRKGGKPGDLVYMTGQVGAGNLEAALMLYSDKPVLAPILNMVHVRFPLRNKEAVLVRKYANCCIDSSDGVFRALLDLTGHCQGGFRIGELVYNSQGQAACKMLGKPEEILFLGECGEYELVFTLSPEKEHDFLTEASVMNLKFNKLGEITENKDMILENGRKKISLAGYAVFARNYPEVKDYINDVVKFIGNG
jgi:thiamine-monophosphate kinase